MYLYNIYFSILECPSDTFYQYISLLPVLLTVSRVGEYISSLREYMGSLESCGLHFHPFHCHQSVRKGVKGGSFQQLIKPPIHFLPIQGQIKPPTTTLKYII